MELTARDSKSETTKPYQDGPLGFKRPLTYPYVGPKVELELV